jgi:hypothetical protein
MGELRQLALARNIAASDRFVRKCQSMAKRRTFRDPHAARQRVRDIVGPKLDRLRPRVEAAEKLRGRIKERLDSGELDDVTARAEEISVEVLTTLFRTLESVYKKADKPYDISCVGVGADMLTSSLKRGLLREETYPSDAQERAEAADRRLTKAVHLYGKVLTALDNTVEELGVKAPKLPTNMVH